MSAAAFHSSVVSSLPFSHAFHFLPPPLVPAELSLTLFFHSHPLAEPSPLYLYQLTSTPHSLLSIKTLTSMASTTPRPGRVPTEPTPSRCAEATFNSVYAVNACKTASPHSWTRARLRSGQSSGMISALCDTRMLLSTGLWRLAPYTT